ncbi:MAG: transcriptional repressor [Candidatus Competibacteraceae bacterium]|nr:transcriptional repressor [Candidatus Competibacteraceae bacterium]
MTPSPISTDSSPSDTGQALAQAETLCQERGVRLTDLRRRVLEIIWSHSKPMGAYAILDVLRDDGRQGAPPTVYRALDFLLEQGLIHRLASLNVYAGCCQPDSRHGGQFLICRDCGQVNEMNSPAVENLLGAEAAARRFEVLTQMVEVLGRCPDCQRGTLSDVG